MSDAGSKDKAVTPASNPLNKGEVIGDIGLYEVLAVVDIKAYIHVTGPVCTIVHDNQRLNFEASRNTDHKLFDRRY